jgi:hypothetical protein
VCADLQAQDRGVLDWERVVATQLDELVELSTGRTERPEFNTSNPQVSDQSRGLYD